MRSKSAAGVQNRCTRHISAFSIAKVGPRNRGSSPVGSEEFLYDTNSSNGVRSGDLGNSLGHFTPADARSSKVVYPEEFWHNEAPTDVVAQAEGSTHRYICRSTWMRWIRRVLPVFPTSPARHCVIS